jgi:hypothetical protein
MSKMNYGFLVANNSGYLKTYNDKYLELREKMFGLAQDFPEAIVPLGKDAKTGVKKVHLRNAHLGLLMTYEQATELFNELKKYFPELNLEIICIEYTDAENIQWYTKDGIINNSNIAP